MSHDEIIEMFKTLEPKTKVAAYDNGSGLSICDASGGVFDSIPAIHMVGIRIFHIPAPRVDFDDEWPKLKALVNSLVDAHNEGKLII